MLLFFLKKLTWTVLTLAVASVIIFFALEVLPGDPAQVILGTGATDESLAALRVEMGLDRPTLVRYFSWIGNLIIGDFGTSYTYDVNVLELIGDAILVSLPLAFFALIISVSLGLCAGLLAASRPNGIADSAVMALSQLGLAVPNFWLAQLLVFIFAISLKLLPSLGFPGWDAGFWPAFKTLILPAIALGLPQAAIIARVSRSSLLDTLGEDYIRTARAKGVTRKNVLWHHALRNAFIPVTTIIGLQFSFLLAGTVIIEKILALPGLGRLIFTAVTQRDLIVVEGAVILLVAIIIFVNLVVDLTYAIIDPRLRQRAS